MVTLYLAGTSIRLESKITVSERMLERYKKFKEEMPKGFSISRTRRGCFAYLNQRYTGSNVAAQAENLENENKKIIEHLAKMKTGDELNLNSCVRILRRHGHNLLADWVYKKLAPMQIQDVEFEQQESCRESDDWDITKAKDGDILATKNGNIFIFKGLLDKLNPKSPVAYCGSIDGYFCISTSNENRWTDEAVVPATKEQRDLLFHKMKRAGYIFDFEKKELKKVEQKTNPCDG